MQGKKERAERLFYQVSLDAFVPEDHLLRKLNRAISLEWVREETKSRYSHTGRPSVDPVVLVKMLLIGYLYDIRSERRLVEEISLNLAYRWYCGFDLEDEVPNHSIFSKARVRFGKELFVTVFEKVLGICIEVGLIGTADIFIDSTLIKANAALNSLVETDLAPDAYWRELEKDETPSSQRGRKPVKEEAMQVGSHFTGIVDETKIGKRRRDKDASYLKKRSTTDPDATLHFRPGIGPALSYKAHMAASTTGIITAVCVSASAAHDTTALPELTARHQKLLGAPASITCDSSYGTEEAFQLLQGQGIKTYIPPMGSRNQPTLFKKERFIYDAGNDCYMCPAGNPLRRRAKNNRTNQIHYKARKEDCQSCSLKSQCIQQKARARTITRYDSDCVEKAHAWLASDKGAMLFGMRKTVIEGLFGQAKSFHGLARAKLRGIEKIEIQVLLTATALNLKKLVKGSLGPMRFFHARFNIFYFATCG